MHETQLAKDLLRVVLTRAGDARVRRVSGEIAEIEALRPEALDFHFQAHARGTPAEGAQLDLRLTHVRARCKACGCVYAPEHHLTLCPECTGTEAEVLGEVGVRISAIEVE